MKKVSFEEKVNFEENLRTPQILTHETFIIRGFLMEKNKIRLVMIMLKQPKTPQISTEET